MLQFFFIHIKKKLRRYFGRINHKCVLQIDTKILALLRVVAGKHSVAGVGVEFLAQISHKKVDSFDRHNRWLFKLASAHKLLDACLIREIDARIVAGSAVFAVRIKSAFHYFNHNNGHKLCDLPKVRDLQRRFK